MAAFVPFDEDEEIVIVGSINDREVAIDEEKQRATAWLDKQSSQMTAYFAQLDKEIADRKAGVSTPEVPFRFESYGTTPPKRTPRRPGSTSSTSAPGTGKVQKTLSWGQLHWRGIVGFGIGLFAAIFVIVGLGLLINLAPEFRDQIVPLLWIGTILILLGGMGVGAGVGISKDGNANNPS